MFFRKRRKKIAQLEAATAEQAFLLKMPDNAFRAVEMPDVIFRKDMTSKEPSTPSQKGWIFTRIITAE